jgi:monofunctional biosynthetic peptidoglycan transglycosylase
MLRFRKIIRWVVGAFFASTILAVIAYRFIPVYITPLMVIRCFQNGSLTIHHHWISLDEMSPHMPVAVMASEDARFLLHHGFDFNAIGQAAKNNIRGGRKHGASTISQQTAKNVFLWPGRSWVRKGFEVYFTALMELFWSKQRIMEVYLNSIEMGPASMVWQPVRSSTSASSPTSCRVLTVRLLPLRSLTPGSSLPNIPVLTCVSANGRSWPTCDSFLPSLRREKTMIRKRRWEGRISPTP